MSISTLMDLNRNDFRGWVSKRKLVVTNAKADKAHFK